MRPLCVAPFTAVLIDTDKGIRPCCGYGNWGQHIPNSVCIARLEDGRTVKDIMEGREWQEVAQAFLDKKVPEGCRPCIDREKETGFGLRKLYDDEDWQKGITYLEVNSTNVCTLQCRHCSGFYSHLWAKVHGVPIHRPDNKILMDSLTQLDLSHLKILMFKGGEPFVNSDVRATLEYVDSIGRLEHTDVSITTNGTVIRDDITDLLEKARSVKITLSIDGVGEVQRYIRHGKSDIEHVERFVAEYAKIPGVSFSPNVSIMTYNVFSLDRIASWWSDLSARVPADCHAIRFGHFVLDPVSLKITCLQDETRRRLADRYRSLDPQLYENVISVLEGPFEGAEAHDDFVRRTWHDDRLLRKSYKDAIPELEPEMVLLDQTRVSTLVGDSFEKLERGELTQALELAAAARTYLGQAAPLAAMRPILDVETRIYAEMGRYDEALALVDLALAENDSDPDALVRRGALLSRAGRQEQARAIASKLTPIAPSHAGELLREIDKPRPAQADAT